MILTLTEVCDPLLQNTGENRGEGERTPEVKGREQFVQRRLKNSTHEALRIQCSNYKQEREKPCEKILRSKITALGDTEVESADRKVGSQNKSRFLAWVTSFKSGDRKEISYYHCTCKCANVCLNLETLKSVFISQLGGFQIQEDCI